MIVVTGAAGFIGSCLITKLNNEGHENLILVDDFSQLQKIDNYHTKKFAQKIERSHFLKWLEVHAPEVTYIFHIGARTDTTEFNVDLFNELNLNYTKTIWNACAKHFIPLAFASSAATYG